MANLILSYTDYWFMDENTKREIKKDFVNLLLETGKITKKELKEKNIDDIVEEHEEEFFEYVSLMKEEDWQRFKEEVEKRFNSWTYFVDAVTETWQGKENFYEPMYFGSFQDILDRLFKTDYYQTKFEVYDDGRIKFIGTHHDWTNIREFIPIENLTRKELMEFIKNREEYFEELKEDVKDIYKKPFGKLNKDELIEIIEERYLYNEKK